MGACKGWIFFLPCVNLIVVVGYSLSDYVSLVYGKQIGSNFVESLSFNYLIVSYVVMVTRGGLSLVIVSVCGKPCVTCDRFGHVSIDLVGLPELEIRHPNGV